MIEDMNIMEISDQDLDAMSADQSAAYAAELWSGDAPAKMKAFRVRKAGETPVVALGDSWFDYQPAGFDILDFLQRMREYEILDHGEAGDTIENMVYGTDFKKSRWRPVRPRLEEALQDVRESGAKFFLVSGGGNDVAGKELENLLNHAATGRPALRERHLDFLVETVFRNAFEALFQKIWDIDPTISIIGHGYGNAIPDGRGVIRVLGYQWIGPWLRPALTKKRILGAEERQQVVTTLISRLNNLLQDLDQTYSNYHAIDARAAIKPSDWENELHLKNSAFRRVALLFHEKIQTIIAQQTDMS